jgi:hypothetical protein
MFEIKKQENGKDHYGAQQNQQSVEIFEKYKQNLSKLNEM